MSGLNPAPFLQNGGLVPAQLQRLSQTISGKPFSTAATNASTTLTSQGGVWPQASGMQVTAQTTPNMTVKIDRGLIVIPGLEANSQGAYPGVANDASLTVTIGTSNTQPRIDAVLWQVRDTVYSGTSDIGQPIVIAGTPASSPVAPSLSSAVNYQLLAYVTVRASTSSILNSDIQDVRHWLTAPGGIQVCRAGELGDVANLAGEYRDTGTTLDRYNGSGWDVAALVGANSGFARYTAGSSIDGIAYTPGNTFRQTFNVAQATCADVTPSGTNNITFTLNRGGVWSIEAGLRFVVSGTIASGSLGFYLFIGVNGSTAEVAGETIEPSFGTSGVVYTKRIQVTRRFSAGDFIEFKLRNNSPASGSSSAAAEAIACDFNWERP